MLTRLGNQSLASPSPRGSDSLGSSGALLTPSTMPVVGASVLQSMQQRIHPRIAARAANLNPRGYPPNVVWQSGGLSQFAQRGSSEKVIGLVRALSNLTMLEVYVQVQPVKEGELPRCESVVGLDDEGDRQAVAGMGLRGMTILRSLTVNGVPWQEVHFSVYVGMPGNIKLVEWDSLEAAVLIALMSAQWKLPVPQDVLLSARLGFYIISAAGCDLLKVGCGKEKVELAKSDTSFRLLLTPNDTKWERHRRVQTLGQVAETLWPEGVELGNFHPYVWDMTRFGVMRTNLEEEGQLVGEAFPVGVFIFDALRAGLVTGFDPTTKHHIIEALLRAPASLATLVGATPGEVSLSVRGEGWLVFDSGHMTGAILAMLNALSEKIVLRDDIVMMLEIDPTGNVRQKVQDPAYHSGIASLLRRNPWIKTLPVDVATRDGVGDELRQESPDVELVGVPSRSRLRRIHVCSTC